MAVMHGMVNLTSFGIQAQIPEVQFNHFYDTFNLFDRDGGGSVDAEELEDVFRSMGIKPTKQQMADFVNVVRNLNTALKLDLRELDQDASGTVEFSEFLRLVVAPRRGSVAHRLISRALGSTRMVWSNNHCAVGIKLDRAVTTATRTDFWQVGSVRAARPLPLQGEAYFEITVRRAGKAAGMPLHGFYFVGVCTEDVSIWDGHWWDDERRKQCWALRSQTCLEEHDWHEGSKTHGELSASGQDGRSEWVEGSSYGHGDVMGVYLDLDKGKLFYYKNQVPIDELPAFRGLPKKQELFPFVTLTHPGSSASISFRPIPTQKPQDSRSTTSGPSTYSTIWSSEKTTGPGITLKSGKTLAVLDSLFVPSAQAPVARPISIRARDKFRLTSMSGAPQACYVEIVVTIPGRRFGASLQGGCYVGLCGEKFKTWDGNWEWGETKRKQVWALHDSFGDRSGEVSTEEYVRRKWSKEKGLDGESRVGYGTEQHPSRHIKPLPGFGSGECIGLLLVPTREGEGDVELFKNGKPRGRLASNIPTHALWPFATLPPQEGATVQLRFPPPPAAASTDDSAQHESAQEAQPQEQTEQE